MLLGAFGVPWWHSQLRIQHCHCCGSSRCCATGSIPGPSTSTCCGCRQKELKNKNRGTLGIWLESVFLSFLAVPAVLSSGPRFKLAPQMLNLLSHQGTLLSQFFTGQVYMVLERCCRCPPPPLTEKTQSMALLEYGPTEGEPGKTSLLRQQPQMMKAWIYNLDKTVPAPL